MPHRDTTRRHTHTHTPAHALTNSDTPTLVHCHPHTHTYTVRESAGWERNGPKRCKGYRFPGWGDPLGFYDGGPWVVSTCGGHGDSGRDT